MGQHSKGNLKGLAPSEIRRIEKLYQRKVDKEEIVPFELAREIFRTAAELRRRIGVIISREGRVEEVVVGTKDILYLPDLGRYRLGLGRLRRLRLIFSDLSNADRSPIIPTDIYTDLEKLRLDMVVSVKEHDRKLQMTYAHLLKFEADGQPSTRTEQVDDIGTFQFDFGSFMEELEAELSTSVSVEQAVTKNRALLVGVYGNDIKDPEASMAELEELCRTAGVNVADKIIQRRTPDPRTLLGKGKLEEVVLRCLRLGAEMIIFDVELKPGQWRTITNSTELKVLDRSMLILDIFAQRATSSDGRLQVELAQLQYNLPRLVEKDSGLSRLSGGIGGRGPGETKLEIGRRRLRDRIVDLERQINKLGSQRQLRRKRRQESSLPLVAIVGYTNVGKSTLFNALTKSGVVAEDKLFATLDPAQRRLVIPHPCHAGFDNYTVVLADTVGFIRNLPQELMNAFRATLEELNEASLLIHVLDASDPDLAERKRSVDLVIESMELGGLPTVNVLNKTDKVPAEAARLLALEYNAIPVSALTKEGFPQLLKTIAEYTKDEVDPQAEAEIAETTVRG
jgi:GTPase